MGHAVSNLNSVITSSVARPQARLLDSRSGCCMAGLVLKSGVTMDTHLVVDASGRHSRLPQWLSDEGFAVPPVATVNSKLGYATRMYHIPTWNKVSSARVCRSAVRNHRPSARQNGNVISAAGQHLTLTQPLLI